MGRRWTTDRQRGGLAIAVIAVIGQIGLSAPASAAPDEGVPAQIQVQPALPPAVAPPLPELDQAFYERLSRSSNPSNRVRSSPLVR